MVIKRKANVFKLVDGKIEYAEIIKQAVLDPKISFKNLHLNDGFDYIDCKFGFIKLLISRGQVAEIETHSDLLVRSDYLAAAKIGANKIYNLRFNFVYKKQTKKSAHASEERVLAAKQKWIDFCAGIAK